MWASPEPALAEGGRTTFKTNGALVDVAVVTFGSSYFHLTHLRRKRAENRRDEWFPTLQRTLQWDAADPGRVWGLTSVFLHVHNEIITKLKLIFVNVGDLLARFADGTGQLLFLPFDFLSQFKF